jgi:hypothetical protein
VGGFVLLLTCRGRLYISLSIYLSSSSLTACAQGCNILLIKDVVRTHGRNAIEPSGKEPELKVFLVDIKNNVDQAINALEYWY